MPELLTTLSWVLWAALILVFIIIEVITVDFVFLMLAIGSVGGLISGLFGVPWPLQIVIAAVLSVLLIFLLRPRLLRALKRGSDPALSNVDALIGLGGTVVVPFEGGRGQVKLANGETWTSTLFPVGTTVPADSSIALAEGDRIVVTAIEGSTAVVAPVERTALS